MDDLTSGFNIGTNYSLSYEFNEMTGFTEEEVREMLTYYTETLHLHNYTVDELIDLMKPWYDNYCLQRIHTAKPPCTIPTWCSISSIIISETEEDFLRI